MSANGSHVAKDGVNIIGYSQRAFLSIDVVGKNHKFISAQSSECVTAAHPVDRCRGKTLQQFISYSMTVGVVYFFETVKVYKKQRCLMGVGTASNQNPTNRLLESEAVAKPG